MLLSLLSAVPDCPNSPAVISWENYEEATEKLKLENLASQASA